MKTVAPDYYKEFHCIADRCRHTCCEGWEIDVDEASLSRFMKVPEIAEKLSTEGTPHIELLPGERCPFLEEGGLCGMILRHGEGMLCNICRDHPRFRSFWSDRVEIGLGMVCEEAARLVLSRPEPMKLVVLEDDGEETEIPEDEAWLTGYRDRLLSEIDVEGPEARLLEYLIFRHIPDALYDGMVKERTDFVYEAYEEIISEWRKSSGTVEEFAECARRFSYDIEYDDEELARRLNGRKWC